MCIYVYLCIKMLVYVNFCVTFSVCITLGWSSHTMVIHGQQNQDGKIITNHWKQNKILEPDSRMINLHHEHPHMPKAGWETTQFHWKQNNTKCQWQYCENIEKHTIRTEQCQSTFLAQPATTIPIHEHCLNTREECTNYMNWFTKN